MIFVSEGNNNSKGKKSVDDPLDELNELDDKIPTIEPENDVFEELEIRDAESIPEYNGDPSSIIKHDPIDAIIDEKEKTVEATKKAQAAKKHESEINQMKEVINELESSNALNDESELKSDVKNTPSMKSSETVNEEGKVNEGRTVIETKTSDKKTKRSAPKPKVKPNRNKSGKVKKIDDVKVDEDGVPLLNQFDTDKIKENSFYNKLHLNKRNVTQIIMVIVGFIILIYGVLQSFNDMVKISDNVLYGEHASMAIAIMFLGILIIVLSFYKEILTLLGIDGLYSNMDSSDNDTIDEYDDGK